MVQVESDGGAAQAQCHPGITAIQAGDPANLVAPQEGPICLWAQRQLEEKVVGHADVARDPINVGTGPEAAQYRQGLHFWLGPEHIEHFFKNSIPPPQVVACPIQRVYLTLRILVLAIDHPARPSRGGTAPTGSFPIALPAGYDVSLASHRNRDWYLSYSDLAFSARLTSYRDRSSLGGELGPGCAFR